LCVDGTCSRHHAAPADRLDSDHIVSGLQRAYCVCVEDVEVDRHIDICKEVTDELTVEVDMCLPRPGDVDRGCYRKVCDLEVRAEEVWFDTKLRPGPRISVVIRATNGDIAGGPDVLLGKRYMQRTGARGQVQRWVEGSATGLRFSAVGSCGSKQNSAEQNDADRHEELFS